MSLGPPMRVACVHLARPERRARFFRGRGGRPFELRLGSGESSLVISFCVPCATRLGAADGSHSSLRLAALTILHRHLHSQLASIVETLAEMTPLLSPAPDAPGTEPPRPRNPGPPPPVPTGMETE